MEVFPENMSSYSLKATGRVTFSLIAPLVMMVDIIVHLIMNSRMQPLVLKNLACSIYHRRYHCSGTSGGSPIVHLELDGVIVILPSFQLISGLMAWSQGSSKMTLFFPQLKMKRLRHSHSSIVQHNIGLVFHCS